jgi:hypothetical protein
MCILYLLIVYVRPVGIALVFINNGTVFIFCKYIYRKYLFLNVYLVRIFCANVCIDCFAQQIFNQFLREKCKTAKKSQLMRNYRYKKMRRNIKISYTLEANKTHR